MLEIVTQNGSLDFDNLQNLQYNMQVSDVFNLSAVKCSYLTSVSLPKTAHNVNIMEGLGIVGDLSRVPYGRFECQVKYYGFEIIKTGWLQVTETSDSYSLSVIDGMIDYFKLIEGRKIGTDLNLSEANHDKTIENVINSQRSNIYRYIIADYGGKVLSDNENINIDYLVPALGIPYLFSKIEEFTGYRFVGSIKESVDFKDLFLTYPKPPKETGQESSDLYIEATRIGRTVPSLEFDFENVQIGGYGIPAGSRIDLVSGRFGTTDNLGFRDNTINEGDLELRTFTTNYFGNVVNYKKSVYKAPVTGTYRIDFTFHAKAQAVYLNQQYYDAPYIEVVLNGNVIDTFKAGLEAPEDYSLYRSLNQGDEIYLNFYITSTRAYYKVLFVFNEAIMKISNTDLGNVDFNEALKDMTITEFFKDILWRFGLTTIANNKDKTILLQTMNEKVTYQNAIDWSDKFIKRTSESYNVPTFGQNSLFVHKYNEEDQSYNDGSFSIRNTLLDERKVIIASKIYSAEQGFTNFPMISQNLPIMKIWNKEVKADNNNNIIINYKSLSSRFYFTKSVTIQVNNLQLDSEILDDNGTTNYISYANVSDVHFNSLVPRYYPKHQLFLDQFKLHNIDLKLSIFDLVNVDLSKIYYFEPEKQFYLINKLTWNSAGGKQGTVKGEFIRVII